MELGSEPEAQGVSEEYKALTSSGNQLVTRSKHCSVT